MLGYRLRGETYQPITDGCSQPLQLRLKVEDKLIGFYRLDTGEKLLIAEELAVALQEETVAKREAEKRAEAERQRAQKAEAKASEAEAKASEAEALLTQYRDSFGDLPVE